MLKKPSSPRLQRTQDAVPAEMPEFTVCFRSVRGYTMVAVPPRRSER
jgi:hypothetical protein